MKSWKVEASRPEKEKKNLNTHENGRGSHFKTE
jgi:hypothetical protein